MSLLEPAVTALEVEIRERLRSIPEPCSLLMRAPTNIYDMGLIERAEVRDGTVRVELVLTDTSCVHLNGMRQFIKHSLLEISGVDAVEVTASRTELWTPDRIVGRPGDEIRSPADGLRSRMQPRQGGSKDG